MRVLLSLALMLSAGLLRGESGESVAAEFPFRYRGGLLWVEVTVPQRERPLRFLLDTGASASVLNLSTARQLGLALGRRVSVAGVGANLTGRWPVKLAATAGHVALPESYLALDLSKLSQACSNSVDGLIGADFFHGRVVQIDYAAHIVRLLGAGPATERSRGIPLQTRRCGLRVRAAVNGHRSQWFRLDTGCATALQWVTTDVPSAGCTSKPAVGLAEISIPQTVTRVRLGDARLDAVPTGLHRRAIFPGESGLLGNALLARFGAITIDSRTGRLVLCAR